MENYRSGPHTRYDIKYQLVREICVANEVEILEGAVAAYIKGQDGTEPDDGGDNFRVPQS